MQSAAPDLADFSKESPETLEMYGVNKAPTRLSPPTACWLAAWWSVAFASSC